MTVTNWNILFGIFYFSDWYWQTCGDCYHRKNQRKLSYLQVSFNTKYLKNPNIILLSFQNHRRGRSEWGWGMWANTRENMDHWSHRRHNQLHPQKSTHLHYTRTGCPEGYPAFRTSTFFNWFRWSNGLGFRFGWLQQSMWWRELSIAENNKSWIRQGFTLFNSKWKIHFIG